MLTITDRVEPGVICEITGRFSPTFLTLNLFSCLTFTYLIYLKICKNIDFNEKFGLCDRKLWQLLFLVSWVATIFGLNKYKPQHLW